MLANALVRKSRYPNKGYLKFLIHFFQSPFYNHTPKIFFFDSGNYFNYNLESYMKISSNFLSKLMFYFQEMLFYLQCNGRLFQSEKRGKMGHTLKVETGF